MKTRIARLVRSICLSIVFVATLFFALQGHVDENLNPNRVHIVAGSLLLTGALIHIATNADWIKMVFSRPTNQLGVRIRLLRRTDLWLFLFAVVCGVSGAMRLVTGAQVAHALHALSGLAMSLLLFIHLLQHWGWLVNTIRTLSKENKLQHSPAQ